MRGCPACSSVVRTSIGFTASAFVARTQARVTFYHLEIAPSAEQPQGAWGGALHDEAARERNSKRVRCHAGEFSLLTSSVQRPSKIEQSAEASKSAGRPFEDDSMCVTVLRRKSRGHTAGWQLLYSVRTAFIRSKRNLEKCGATPEGKDYLSCPLSDKRTPG